MFPFPSELDMPLVGAAPSRIQEKQIKDFLYELNECLKRSIIRRAIEIVFYILIVTSLLACCAIVCGFAPKSNYVHSPLYPTPMDYPLAILLYPFWDGVWKIRTVILYRTVLRPKILEFLNAENSPDSLIYTLENQDHCELTPHIISLRQDYAKGTLK